MDPYTITDIYKYDFNLNDFSFIGTLRNEKKFNLEDNIFFGFTNGACSGIARGKIVGIELPPKDNPEFIYKITLPKNLIFTYDSKKIDTITLTCKDIFNTVQEAKKSAIKQLDLMYKLQKQKLEDYFNNYK